MGRGAWLATVHGVARIGYDIVTKPPPPKLLEGFLRASDGKESACNAGDLGSIPGSGRSPGKGNCHPLQCSCLEDPPWIEEPCGVQSRGSKRVGHD